VTELEMWLTQYETDVRFPDVSGFEHLDMLLTRSRIFAARKSMTPEQKERLAEADQQLLAGAETFLHAIAAVASLTEWRVNSAGSPEEWWWYLDVLVNVPQAMMVGGSNA